MMEEAVAKSDMMEQLNKAKEYLLGKGIVDPQAGIVLGTGLHQLLNHVEIKAIIPYADIPGFPVSTVEFHKGNLVYAQLGAKNVLIMQGRFHAYEGYTLQQVVFPVRVMKLLGIRWLLLSNAAGGINLDFKRSDMVLIDDHINLLGGSPLSGKNEDQLGMRFPDMSQPYSEDMKQLLQRKAGELGIGLRKGVYAAVHGPNLETKAEYRYLKVIGADMVGMSTVPEVIAAIHMKLPCLAVSVITDECDPDNLQPVNIEEIIAAAQKADEKLSRLFFEFVKELR